MYIKDKYIVYNSSLYSTGSRIQQYSIEGDGGVQSAL